ncbi:hypothetical protein [Streptomyces sp. NPDC003952]
MTKDISVPALDNRAIRVLSPWSLSDSAVLSVVPSSGRHHRMDREQAGALIEALTAAVSAYDEAEAAEHAVQLAADVEAAKALEIGTRVQISESPVRERDGEPHPVAERIAGKVGTVNLKVDGSDSPDDPYGVHAGRVRVRVPGAERFGNRGEYDIHVSSLTVLPPEPEFNVGDRVEVVGWSRTWDGVPAVVESEPYTTSFGGPYISIRRESDGVTGGFGPRQLRALPIDYAAKAAEFKVGDLALVGDNPATGAKPDGGYGVNQEYAGKAVNVVEAAGWSTGPEIVRVQLNDTQPQYIHVAHLTKAKAVPA